MALYLPMVQKDVFGGPPGTTRNASLMILQGILQGMGKRKATEQNNLLSGLFAGQQGGGPADPRDFANMVIQNPDLTPETKNRAMQMASAMSTMGVQQAQAERYRRPDIVKPEKPTYDTIWAKNPEGQIEKIDYPKGTANATIKDYRAMGYKDFTNTPPPEEKPKHLIINYYDPKQNLWKSKRVKDENYNDVVADLEKRGMSVDKAPEKTDAGINLTPAQKSRIKILEDQARKENEVINNFNSGNVDAITGNLITAEQAAAATRRLKQVQETIDKIGGGAAPPTGQQQIQGVPAQGGQQGAATSPPPPPKPPIPGAKITKLPNGQIAWTVVQDGVTKVVKLKDKGNVPTQKEKNPKYYDGTESEIYGIGDEEAKQYAELYWTLQDDKKIELEQKFRPDNWFKIRIEINRLERERKAKDRGRGFNQRNPNVGPYGGIKG